ncbi:antitoxin ParD1/3/4 [Nitrospirillum amazonense]|uniref:Antitoxin ParD1/3/4 n=1 Tax=Nitrospirillum amazonense TaxID=28077 RepID=A0A560F6I6_9PROT|nr:type II toxin-antitoxin system ParD family antitoxin [Nitrospirillum amazonense]TWB17240.1 antitoxin ParD1/3/4 [Nitrospirillum amazonense]
MSKRTSVSLDPHYTKFVEEQINEGRYDTANDVVRAGLRLLEEHETKLAALRSALVDGEESGPVTDFDFEDFIARKRTARPSDR